MPFLIGIAVVVMLAGGIFYNKLRAKVYGIIGVPGSYFATLGIMVLVMLIGSLFQGGGGASITEIVVYIIFMIAGLGYLAYVMITKCQTVMQRVLLPIIAVMIAFGFCWRLVFALIFKIPMSNGAPQAKFPASLTDDQGETWNLQSDSNDHADYYCPKTGATTTVWYTGDYVNLPAGWRAN
ncbi:MAG: hypothetical protein IJ043_00330 [Clostridia bacterium]|nr:hypothetical protein [Clostridia bacterium]